MLHYHWFNYREAGSYTSVVRLIDADKPIASFTAPDSVCSLHFILELKDSGMPALTRYGRIIVNVE